VMATLGRKAADHYVSPISGSFRPRPCPMYPLRFLSGRCWPKEKDDGYFTILSRSQMTAGMECRAAGWRQARSQAAADMGDPILPRSRRTHAGSCLVRSRNRCDLVKIKIGTLVAGPSIRARSMVIQQKTGWPVQFEITSDARGSLLAWLGRRGGTVDDYISKSS
jgi:hypothetical protein